MTRVVVDTNVLVSALVRGGKPRRLVLELLDDHSLLLSAQMLAELVEVLSRQKFRLVGRGRIDRFVSGLIRESEISTVRSHLEVVEQDQDDNTVLATAHDGNADYVVTGDKHLLVLRQFKGIRIVKVTEMLEVLLKESKG